MGEVCQNKKKKECANHVCKCLRSNLKKLVIKNPQFKGKGKLTKNTRVQLVNAVRCAIIIKSKEKDQRNTAKKNYNMIL